MKRIKEVQEVLRGFGSAEKAAVLQGFFKTGPGEYGEGDIFIGVKVPEIRSLVKNYCLTKEQIPLILLHSKIHEERLFALMVMVSVYAKATDEKKRKIYELNLKNTEHINNWDLVDLSAPQIVGAHLFQLIPRQEIKDEKRRKVPGILNTLAASSNLWERRIAIISTLYFIKNTPNTNIYNRKESAPLEITYILCEKLLNDKEDLIHKACGWMLREAGKKDRKRLEVFLTKNYNKIPRTMLRYSIERFPEELRKKYLHMGK
ncbi:MAG: DNA alkylation repair protein [Candidatus Omnitrophica bacterium]|nr:DNA alkylation repair protein [Candidatus Omnitrophota bacterium]